MEKKRRISSGWTFYYKVITPLLAVLFLGGFALGAVAKSGDPDFLAFFLGIGPFILCGVGYSLWVAFRLRIVIVDVDDEALYVYTNDRELQIPISDIDRIEESYGLAPKLITLCFKSHPEIGNRIVFMPSYRPFESLRIGHPIIGQLEALKETNTRERIQNRA